MYYKTNQPVYCQNDSNNYLDTNSLLKLKGKLSNNKDNSPYFDNLDSDVVYLFEIIIKRGKYSERELIASHEFLKEYLEPVSERDKIENVNWIANE